MRVIHNQRIPLPIHTLHLRNGLWYIINVDIYFNVFPCTFYLKKGAESRYNQVYILYCKCISSQLCLPFIKNGN